MRAVVILAGVADGIPVDITPAKLETLKKHMRPSRPHDTISVTTTEGGTVTLAADMICAIHVPATTEPAGDSKRRQR